jgi:non-ribosomal peptide synthetase-like protein
MPHSSRSADFNNIASAHSSNILYGTLRPDLIRQEILADLFEATADKSPEQAALIFADRVVSYAELNICADIAASKLIEAGVLPGHILGLWLPRGIDLLIMQVAIAKAGAAWLPFDADTPVERIAVCLEDAKAFGLLSCDLLREELNNIQCAIWTAEQILAPSALPLHRRKNCLPSDPAYVIYTSGSTGKPKGIAINQGSICHFLRSENSLLGIQNTDRVYQGFSVAFDMSFEEIWISYLVGATLWIAPREIAVDPDALPQALAQNQVTVLHAVPTLLALFNEEVPSLRIINLGGEMCPESLVARWLIPGRQLFNTYGPTEATVSASLAELKLNEAVTIGRPLPNYGLLVIEPTLENGLVLLKRGEVGELCITGPGVADGYLGRPELSLEKFIDNPWSSSELDKRMYRTGDLARIAEDGTVQCLGRSDDQVKIRGFRVELGEIEAALSKQAGVGTAAVLLRHEDGIDQLIAFIVADMTAESIADSTIDAGSMNASLRASLTTILPPYMVPGRYEYLSEMPRLTSGKIDRKELKNKVLTVVAARSDSDTANNPAEEVLFAALGKLFPGQAIRRDLDFFSDLGGHSLLAARLVSALRVDARFMYFKVSDIYLHRHIGQIAIVLAQSQSTATNEEKAWTPPSAIKRWVCGLAQAIVIPWLVVMRMMQWLAPFFAYHFFTGEADDSIAMAIFLSVGVFLLLTVSEFFIAIIGKWLIAGRLKAGCYPLWGFTYFRWWLADRLVESAPVYLLSGSSLYVWWLRALGAKVGRDVNIGSTSSRAPDLLHIGDNVSIGNACNFENARVERGELRLGQITLGHDSCVGSYSILEGETSIADFGHLEGQSALSEGQTIPAGRIWRGSPARDIGAFKANPDLPRPMVSSLRLVGEAVFFIFGSLLITILFFLPVFPSFITIDLIDNVELFPWLQGNSVPFQLGKYFLLAFPATAILIVLTALLSAGIRWSVLPKLKAGSYPVHGNIYCSKWLVNQIQESSLNILHGVYATVFAPFWYRLLGAKVGKGAEISTALGVVPDMLTLGDETFIADAVLLGDEHIDGGWMTMKPTVISRRSFVGNCAYIPDGTVLPENVLIGVHSSAPANQQMHDGDTWLGSPPIHLPAREETKGFPEELTFHPSFMRRLGRTLIESFRIIAPHALVISVGYTIVLDLMPLAGDDQWGEVVYYLALSGLWYGAGCFVFVLALKWLLIFRYKKKSAPMWTGFVWISEAVTNLYEGIAVPNFMRYLRGTPWLPLAFNLLGCKIGKGVYLDTTDITEFDCVSIGAHSEVNALACPQTHLFEDRVMKIDHVKIGERVYMGPRSAVLYSAVVGDDAKLGALTLVMKGEFIPEKSSWRGCPAAIAQG